MQGLTSDLGNWPVSCWRGWAALSLLKVLSQKRYRAFRQSLHWNKKCWKWDFTWLIGIPLMDCDIPHDIGQWNSYNHQPTGVLNTAHLAHANSQLRLSGQRACSCLSTEVDKVKSWSTHALNASGKLNIGKSILRNLLPGLKHSILY